MRLNPIAWIEGGIIVNDNNIMIELGAEEKYVIVNEAFLLWVYELKEEIKKLRNINEKTK